MPIVEFADRLLLRLHMNETGDELFDYLTTAFGFECADVINEIINEIDPLIKNTSDMFQPFLDIVLKEEIRVACSTESVDTSFSMEYKKPYNGQSDQKQSMSYHSVFEECLSSVQQTTISKLNVSMLVRNL